MLMKLKWEYSACQVDVRPQSHAPSYIDPQLWLELPTSIFFYQLLCFQGQLDRQTLTSNHDSQASSPAAFGQPSCFSRHQGGPCPSFPWQLSAPESIYYYSPLHVVRDKEAWGTALKIENSALFRSNFKKRGRASMLPIGLFTYSLAPCKFPFLLQLIFIQTWRCTLVPFDLLEHCG